MSTVKLINPTDDELNAAFAVNVCGAVDLGGASPRISDAKSPGLFIHRYNGKFWISDAFELAEMCRPHRWDYMHKVMNFTTSADAVLPWLEKWAINSLFAPVHYTLLDGTHSIRLQGAETVKDKSFPRAAVIALLRANGIEVEIKA